MLGVGEDWGAHPCRRHGAGQGMAALGQLQGESRSFALAGADQPVWCGTSVQGRDLACSGGNSDMAVLLPQKWAKYKQQNQAGLLWLKIKKW